MDSDLFWLVYRALSLSLLRTATLASSCHDGSHSLESVLSLFLAFLITLQQHLYLLLDVRGACSALDDLLAREVAGDVADQRHGLPYHPDIREAAYLESAFQEIEDRVDVLAIKWKALRVGCCQEDCYVDLDYLFTELIEEVEEILIGLMLLNVRRQPARGVQDLHGPLQVVLAEVSAAIDSEIAHGVQGRYLHLLGHGLVSEDVEQARHEVI